MLSARSRERPHDSYATRYVGAASPQAAEQVALAVVPDQVRAVYANRHGEPCQLFIEEVWEFHEPAERTPGSGFTWFAEGLP